MRWSFEVGNILAEALNNWIVGKQQFNAFPFRKLHSLGDGKRATSWEYQISLLLEVCLLVVSEWLGSWLQEVPMQLDRVQIEFFKPVFGNLEQRALHGSHECTPLGNGLTGVKSSHRFHLEHLLNDLLESWNAGATTNHLDPVQHNLLFIEFGLDLFQSMTNVYKHGFREFLELLSLHVVHQVVFLHEVF